MFVANLSEERMDFGGHSATESGLMNLVFPEDALQSSVFSCSGAVLCIHSEVLLRPNFWHNESMRGMQETERRELGVLQLKILVALT